MSLTDEMRGRMEFDRYRRSAGIPYDWADLSDAEKQKWIEKAREREAEADK